MMSVKALCELKMLYKYGYSHRSGTAVAHNGGPATCLFIRNLGVGLMLSDR